MPSETTSGYFGKPKSVVSSELKATEEVECPVCRVPPKMFAVDYQGFHLCRCPVCDLEFVNPRLSFDQLAESVYTDAYFAGDGNTDQLSPNEISKFAHQTATYERLLGRRGSLLDVGCGSGAFLRFAHEAGWKVSGTDIHIAPEARRLEFPLWGGRLQDVDFGDNRFDLIRFNHVLEHTQNPLAELTLTRELLNPAGIIHISVPNIAGISPRMKNLQSRLFLKSRRCRHYAAMHHLFFFAPKTVRRVVEAAGLRVLHWETPVLGKEHQHPAIEELYRQTLGRLHTASILDFYCTFA